MATTRKSASATPAKAEQGTTRVRIVTAIYGTRNGQDWPVPGETVDLPSAEADDLVRSGVAEPA